MSTTHSPSALKAKQNEEKKRKAKKGLVEQTSHSPHRPLLFLVESKSTFSHQQSMRCLWKTLQRDTLLQFWECRTTKTNSTLLEIKHSKFKSRQNLENVSKCCFHQRESKQLFELLTLTFANVEGCLLHGHSNDEKREEKTTILIAFLRCFPDCARQTNAFHSCCFLFTSEQ